MIQQFHSWIYIQKEKKITNLKRYMNAYVHSSTIHNRQHMQATQLPISRQMDKEDAVHTHTRAHTHTHKDTTQPLTATWMDLKEPAVYTAQGTLLNTL